MINGQMDGMASIPRVPDENEQPNNFADVSGDVETKTTTSPSTSGGESEEVVSSSSDDDIVNVSNPEGTSPSRRSFGDMLRGGLDNLKGRAASIAAPITNVFSGASSAVAATIGVSPALASGLTALALVATCGGVGAGVYAIANPELNPALFVSNPSCTEKVAEAVRAADTSDVDEDAQKIENAHQVWSVLSEYCGMDDVAIAGLLSNFDAESGIDPTTVETIYDEPYKMGPRKTAAAADFNAFKGPCQAAYAKGSAVSVNWNAYMVDGEFWPGIGLAQWTGGGSKAFAETAESTVDGEWWRMDYSVAYMIATGSPCGGGGGKDFFDKSKSDTYAAQTFSTPKEASRAFSLGFEHGSMPENLITGHAEQADYWFGFMPSGGGSWTPDSDFVASVTEMASNMGAQANTKRANEERQECSPCKASLGDYDNSSLAAAIVSYAYPTTALGVGNNGTDLYQAVHDGVFPGDGYYMSCDRTVASAVRWSGADESYPPGSTTETLSHMVSSPLWEDVTSTITTNQSDGGDAGGEFGLLPGDVLNTSVNGHILMYVGKDIIQEIHGDAADSASNGVSGSLGTRSPGCQVITVTSASGSEIHISGDSRAYRVFRRVAEDVEPYSEKYKDVAELADVSISTGSSSSNKNCNSSGLNMNNVNSTTLHGDANWSGVQADNNGAAVINVDDLPSSEEDGETVYEVASGKKVKDTTRFVRVDENAIVSQDEWKAGDDDFKRTHFYFGEVILLQYGDVQVRATVEDTGTFSGEVDGTKKIFEFSPIVKSELGQSVYAESVNWDDGVRLNWKYPADYYKQNKQQS